MNPNDIEKHSFEIIEQELEIELPSDIKPIVKRVIHTTADFSYAENMYFSPDAIKTALGEIKSGVTFVTDTNMALSGINKKALKELNCNAVCYVSDEDVAVMAKKQNITRAVCAVKKAAIDAGTRDNITSELVDGVILKELKVAKEQVDTCPAEYAEQLDEYRRKYDIIKSFAPAQMSEEELYPIIKGKFGELIASGNKGAYMKAVMSELKGKADGKLINKVISDIAAGK